MYWLGSVFDMRGVLSIIEHERMKV